MVISDALLWCIPSQKSVIQMFPGKCQTCILSSSKQHFGKIGRIASEKLILQLILSKCNLCYSSYYMTVKCAL